MPPTRPRPVRRKTANKRLGIRPNERPHHPARPKPAPSPQTAQDGPGSGFWRRAVSSYRRRRLRASAANLARPGGLAALARDPAFWSLAGIIGFVVLWCVILVDVTVDRATASALMRALVLIAAVLIVASLIWGNHDGA